NIGGDTVIVVNNHLASTRLTTGDSEDFKKIIEGKFSRDSATIASTKIAEKLSKSTLKRAVQVDSLMNYLQRHQDKSIILCGDFNDSPISHSHRAMASLLTDCFRESGNGLGISYHENRFYVRIDHIFCSADWTPYACYVDSKNDLSDHYPIVCRLKKTEK
ncbi:MAG: endonuclease/exonuclease/phosphatase family protein, partial [Prevotella sp.]|nr:endonuclease/exonuclease/phosphatase family protein [Prevotella sp.]